MVEPPGVDEGAAVFAAHPRKDLEGVFKVVKATPARSEPVAETGSMTSASASG
jgi:hypothetical protein